jgi:hypothetical protein
MARASRLLVMMGVVIAVLGAPSAAEVVGAERRDLRRLARCEQAIAREGLAYTHRAIRRLMRCLEPLGECNRAGVALDPTACAAAEDPCAELPDDLEALETRLQARVAAACHRVPLPRLLDEVGFAARLQGCEAGSHDAFAACLVRSLRNAVDAEASRLRPDFCGLAAAAELTDVLPPGTCAGAAGGSRVAIAPR